MPVIVIPEAALQREREAIARTARDELERAIPDTEARNAIPELHKALAWGKPADQIVHAARKLGADLIVMGTHGRTGWRRAALGSVAEAVVRHAPCTVTCVKP